MRICFVGFSFPLPSILSNETDHESTNRHWFVFIILMTCTLNWFTRIYVVYVYLRTKLMFCCITLDTFFLLKFYYFSQFFLFCINEWSRLYSKHSIILCDETEDKFELVFHWFCLCYLIVRWQLNIYHINICDHPHMSHHRFSCL